MYESAQNSYYELMKASSPNAVRFQIKLIILEDKTMNNEINAVELSNDELDTVAGGLAITLGDVGGFASDASNSYSLKQLQVGQQTFAGPTGSGTASVTNLTDIFSNAGQAIAVK